MMQSVKIMALTALLFGLMFITPALAQEEADLAKKLANHVWSVPGEDDRADISATFLQPFLSYITKTKTTISLNSESTYDWENSEWSVPINFVVSQLLKIGKLPIQIGVGARYWVDSPDAGPEDWGARAQLTFLFPK
jgi:hypothetical protein